MVAALEQLLYFSGDSAQLVLLHETHVPGEVLICLVEILRPIHKSLMLAAVLYTVNTCTSGPISHCGPTLQIFSPESSAESPFPALFSCWLCCQTSRNQCQAWDHGRRLWGYNFSRKGGECSAKTSMGGVASRRQGHWAAGSKACWSGF